ncbi:hypothetical protein ABZT03_15175 [Streptomyces sp. NPDC005574]|uniref:hypothetical protein n=1 Tax=Streptomyces sp. NPDC005574 TaxID=3156891 RepID=UPI0033A984F5
MTSDMRPRVAFLCADQAEHFEHRPVGRREPSAAPLPSAARLAEPVWSAADRSEALYWYEDPAGTGQCGDRLHGSFMHRVLRALWGGCCLAVMHVFLVPPVDSVDHPAVWHLTTAVDTALSGSDAIGMFLRPGSAGRVDPVGPEAGDDALHEETGGLFTLAGTASAGSAASLAGSPRHVAAGWRGYLGDMAFPRVSAAGPRSSAASGPAEDD